MYINTIDVQFNSTDNHWWIGELTDKYEFTPIKGGFKTKLAAYKAAEKMIDKEHEKNKSKFF